MTTTNSISSGVTLRICFCVKLLLLERFPVSLSQKFLAKPPLVGRVVGPELAIFPLYLDSICAI